MRTDDDYSDLGIKIFYEDNSWKFANDSNDKNKSLNKGNSNKNKLRRLHTQSFL